jgi:hypothetical protein
MFIIKKNGPLGFVILLYSDTVHPYPHRESPLAFIGYECVVSINRAVAKIATFLYTAKFFMTKFSFYFRMSNKIRIFAAGLDQIPLVISKD